MNAAVKSCLVLLAVARAEQQERPGSAESATSASAAALTDEWAHRQASSGRCQMILTSGYGYRQFIPLQPFVAPPGPPGKDDPGPLLPPSTAAPSEHVPVNASAPPGEDTAAAPNASLPGGQRLLLRFQVMAESDAHILLSAQRRSDREAYEVVLGAGNNSYTDFRRLPASVPPRRAFNYSAGVLSGEGLRGFWLLVDLATGTLAVGPDGGPPILAWVDRDPVRVRYFSLCTWMGVQGTWLYGCDHKAGGSSTVDAEGMSPTERMLEHVLAPHKRTVPHFRHDVTTHLQVERFSVDDRDLVLSMFGTMVLEWRDERLSWTPADYSGLNSSFVPSSEIWVPDVRPVDPAQLTWSTPSRVHLDSSGRVRLRVDVQVKARCSVVDAVGGGVLGFSCDTAMAATYPAAIAWQTLQWNEAPKTPNQKYKLKATARVWRSAGANWTADVDGGVLRVRMQRRGCNNNVVFLSASIVACSMWLSCVLLPEPVPVVLVSGEQDRHPRPRTLVAALNVLMVAVALLSLQAAVPPAVLAAAPSGVGCLSAALLLGALGLVLPTFVVGRGLVPLPRPLARVLRNQVLSTLVLGNSSSSLKPKWRDYPNGTAPEQVLELLDAMDAEEATRDWHVLTLVLEKLCAVLCLCLAVAALLPDPL